TRRTRWQNREHRAWYACFYDRAVSKSFNTEAQTARRLCWPLRGQLGKNERPRVQDQPASQSLVFAGLSFFPSAFGAKSIASPQSPLTQPTEKFVSRL